MAKFYVCDHCRTQLKAGDLPIVIQLVLPPNCPDMDKGAIPIKSVYVREACTFECAMILTTEIAKELLINAGNLKAKS